MGVNVYMYGARGCAWLMFDPAVQKRNETPRLIFLLFFACDGMKRQEEAKALQGEAAQAKQEAQEALRMKDKARYLRWFARWVLVAVVVRSVCVAAGTHAIPPFPLLSHKPKHQPPPLSHPKTNTQTGPGADGQAGGGRGRPPRAAPAAGGGDGPAGRCVGSIAVGFFFFVNV